MAVRIALDAFPYTVKMPSGARHQNVRVLVADGDLVVLNTSTSATVDEIFRRRLVSSEGSRISGFTFQVDGGDEISARRSGGCGCGSPLKNYNPWPGQQRITVPL